MQSVLLFCSLILIVLSSVNSKAFNAVKDHSYVSQDQVTRPINKSESKGGQGGVKFDDFNLLQYIVGVHSINMSYTEQINSIAVTYIMAGGLLYSGPLHGKLSGPVLNLTLGPKEYIYKLEGQTNGELVSQLTFKTASPGNDLRTYGPYGKEGSTKFALENNVVAFHGSSDTHLNSIGIYGIPALNKSVLYGGKGGVAFNDGLPQRIPPVVGIRSISIWNGVVIDGLQAEFVTLGGNFLMGGKHGSAGSNNMTKIDLNVGDHLVNVYGTADTTTSYSVNLVTQLGFTVQKSTGEKVKYGPYGGPSNQAFNFTGKIVGFLGYAGSQIDKIGVFFVTD